MQAAHSPPVMSKHLQCNSQGHSRTHLSRQLNWRRWMHDRGLCCCCCCLLLVARLALVRAGSACRRCTSFSVAAANSLHQENWWVEGGGRGGREGGGYSEAGGQLYLLAIIDAPANSTILVGWGEPEGETLRLPLVHHHTKKSKAMLCPGA